MIVVSLLLCRTCCKKQAWIKCSVKGLSRAVEKFGIERYRKNSKKVKLYDTVVDESFPPRPNHKMMLILKTQHLWLFPC